MLTEPYTGAFCKDSACGNICSRYPVRKRLSLVRGDAFAFSVRLNFSGNARMLGLGDHVHWAIRSACGDIVINKEFNYLNQNENGYMSLSLLPSDTITLDPGVYAFEVEFCFSQEKAVITAVKGILEVQEDLITLEVRNDSQFV